MVSSKRRKISTLPLLYPVHGSRPKVGDEVVGVGFLGDPRNPRTSLKNAAVTKPGSTLQPMFLSNFILIEHLTDEECAALQDIITVPITAEFRSEINAAIHHMTATIALSARVPGWKDFEERLRDIIKAKNEVITAAEHFLQMTYPSETEIIASKGVLSVDQAVKTYLALSGFGQSHINIDIGPITRACEQGLKDVELLASKRGRRSDHALIRFLHLIYLAAKSAGAPIKLPSDKIREKNETRSTTPFFLFARECVKIAALKGIAAISAAQLTDEEKSDAEKVLTSYVNKYTAGTRKSDGALLGRLRPSPLPRRNRGQVNSKKFRDIRCP
jgi:hypothetical protein